MRVLISSLKDHTSINWCPGIIHLKMFFLPALVPWQSFKTWFSYKKYVKHSPQVILFVEIFLRPWILIFASIFSKTLQIKKNNILLIGIFVVHITYLGFCSEQLSKTFKQNYFTFHFHIFIFFRFSLNNRVRHPGDQNLDRRNSWIFFSEYSEYL